MSPTVLHCSLSGQVHTVKIGIYPRNEVFFMVRSTMDLNIETLENYLLLKQISVPNGRAV